MKPLTYSRPVANRSAAPVARDLTAPLTKTIPFDYVFEFKLTGKSASNVQDVVKLQDVVEISMQGVFVAVSMGYSFVLDEQKTPRNFGPAIGTSTTPITSFVPVTRTATAAPAIEGIQVNGVAGSEIVIIDIANQTQLATGTIGTDGKVVIMFPFQEFTSSLRVLDKTNNLVSHVNMVVGVLTPVVGPDLTTNRLPVEGDETVTVYGNEFDEVLVSILDVRGNLLVIDGRHKLSVATPIGTEGLNFTQSLPVPLKVAGVDRPLSAGDVVIVQSGTGSADSPVLSSTYSISRVRPSTLPLRAIADGLASINVGNASGFRFSPRFAPLVAADVPFDQIDPTILSTAFEPAGSEDISFLYTIDVLGTGRELQNKPIHNIAGLGSANGDRPFRPFARPMVIEPRTSIRIQIEELSTLPGTLYIVLQGYKTLGTGRMPE
ncbi:MAG TPA: hypothetical protein VF088_05000 [Pyrinomonadaceae bacterium]